MRRNVEKIGGKGNKKNRPTNNKNDEQKRQKMWNLRKIGKTVSPVRQKKNNEMIKNWNF